MTIPPDPRRDARAREPVFNAPWPVAALIAGLVGAHALRVVAGTDVDRFALNAVDFNAGRLGGLITHQFVHAGWAHVLMNAAFVLAFGPPVARYLGPGPRGAAGFFVFFLVCGAAAAAGYGVLADGMESGRGESPAWALLGASGAASGLMGASARLLEGGGRLGRIVAPRVAAMSASWIVINLVLGLSGLTPGAGGAPVAWQAHILGYFVGLFIIGPFGALSGMRRDHANAL
jgi:membrane associated rhomboid family serine protease